MFVGAAALDVFTLTNETAWPLAASYAYRATIPRTGPGTPEAVPDRQVAVGGSASGEVAVDGGSGDAEFVGDLLDGVSAFPV